MWWMIESLIDEVDSDEVFPFKQGKRRVRRCATPGRESESRDIEWALVPASTHYLS